MRETKQKQNKLRSKNPLQRRIALLGSSLISRFVISTLVLSLMIPSQGFFVSNAYGGNAFETYRLNLKAIEMREANANFKDWSAKREEFKCDPEKKLKETLASREPDVGESYDDRTIGDVPEDELESAALFVSYSGQSYGLEQQSVEDGPVSCLQDSDRACEKFALADMKSFKRSPFRDILTSQETAEILKGNISSGRSAITLWSEERDYQEISTRDAFLGKVCEGLNLDKCKSAIISVNEAYKKVREWTDNSKRKTELTDDDKAFRKAYVDFWNREGKKGGKCAGKRNQVACFEALWATEVSDKRLPGSWPKKKADIDKKFAATNTGNGTGAVSFDDVKKDWNKASQDALEVLKNIPLKVKEYNLADVTRPESLIQNSGKLVESGEALSFVKSADCIHFKRAWRALQVPRATSNVYFRACAQEMKKYSTPEFKFNENAAVCRKIDNYYKFYKSRVDVLAKELTDMGVACIDCKLGNVGLDPNSAFENIRKQENTRMWATAGAGIGSAVLNGYYAGRQMQEFGNLNRDLMGQQNFARQQYYDFLRQTGMPGATASSQWGNGQFYSPYYNNNSWMNPWQGNFNNPMASGWGNNFGNMWGNGFNNFNSFQNFNSGFNNPWSFGNGFNGFNNFNSFNTFGNPGFGSPMWGWNS